MASPGPEGARGSSRALLAALCALLALGGLFGWRMIRAARPKPQRLILMEAPAGQWSGLSMLQRRGLLMLLKDCLETDGLLTVSLAEGMGTPTPDTPVLQIAGRRVQLELHVETAWIQGARGEFTHEGPPQQVIGALCRDLGIAPASLPRLVSAAPDRAWDLLETSGWGGDRDTPHCMELSRRLSEAEPELASAWCAYAQQSFRELTLDPRLGAQAQEEAEERFKRALELVPGYPRACYDYGSLLTDSARQSDAMKLLFGALDQRPHAASLYSNLAYAARTSGLLDGAQRALRRREALLGPKRFESGLVENTYLYLGDFERFRTLLGEDDHAPWRSMRDFYRGYIRLVEGHVAEALPFFRRAHLEGGAALQFEQLAGVFVCQLEGKPEEARQRLDRLSAEHAKLREPDGEFTFKLAETYAFLGDLDNAEDMALRAYSQGFACSRWYRMSPLLKPLQEVPRFKALLQHIDERQALLESRFPASRFGT